VVSGGDRTGPSNRVLVAKHEWVPKVLSCLVYIKWHCSSTILTPGSLTQYWKPPGVVSGGPGACRAKSLGGAIVGR
jgi:hypothetical protein